MDQGESRRFLGKVDCPKRQKIGRSTKVDGSENETTQAMNRRFQSTESERSSNAWRMFMNHDGPFYHFTVKSLPRDRILSDEPSTFSPTQ